MTKIRIFQEAVAARLNESETLVQGGCRALAEDALDLVRAVQEQVSQTGGVAVVVTTPDFERDGSGWEGDPASCRLAVRCIEKPALRPSRCGGRGGLTALGAAEAVKDALRGAGVNWRAIRQTADAATGTVTATAEFDASVMV